MQIGAGFRNIPSGVGEPVGVEVGVEVAVAVADAVGVLVGVDVGVPEGVPHAPLAISETSSTQKFAVPVVGPLYSNWML